ncbi:ABC transporter substrate-binding protein [Desertihabitans brevis]|uniref:ABC transporter substrate-binding protein n=1 Tax=Desertihabitans brevis TaxID=2268447 RepID=A0A367YSM9_9ACTN|nr:ABC transporter substrate-binding protein [Desertihabitans brevis]RCK68800.1 ABC transporter substrate-binding protein [Desertihabitans brevis]
MTRRPILAATALAVAVTLSACGGGGGGGGAGTGAGAGATSLTDEPAQGGTVSVLLNADFSYLDPQRGFDGGVNNFYRLVYRTLTTAAPGNAEDPSAMVPDLATDLGTVSEDGLTWTFTLKEGVAFDDGTPITSADVRHGISRAWDPALGIGSPYAKQVIDAPEDYEGPYRSGELETIETPDDQTIVFHLKEPFPDFPAVLGQPNTVPFPVGTGEGEEFLTDIIASGPYDLAEYQPGQSLSLVRNEAWDQSTDEVRTAKPDAWEFTFGLDGATIDERLLAGQGADVNAIGGAVQSATVARLQTPQVQQRVFEPQGVCTTYMGLNTTKEPLGDVRVRQAINLAIDKTAVQNASGGTQLATVATTILPPSIAGHVDYDLYPRDVEKARALLEEAGVGDGFELVLDIRSQPKMQAQAEAVQQSLAEVGIDVSLNVIDTSTYYETIGTTTQQNDAAITGWCPDWASSASTFIPPLFYGPNIVEKGNSNLAQIDDPEINAAIEEAQLITDRAEANQAWGELDQLVMSKAPVVPLLVETGLTVVGENVTGLHASPGAATGGIDYVLVGLRDPEAG